MVSKETKIWLRALGIAKILFEDQASYLQGIKNLVIKKANLFRLAGRSLYRKDNF